MTEIVGREEELAALQHFLGREPDGPRALVLEGEAGIGKSTLWLAGVEGARVRGFRVLSSRPAEAELGLDFAGLGDLFEGALEEVLPSLAPPRRHALEVALLLEESGETADPRALGVAVRSALETLAAEQPLVLAVDDVQWLDRSSASALAFALRRVDRPLTVLLARRVSEGSEPSELEQVLAPGAVERMPVSPLSVGAIQTLLRDRLERVFPRPTLMRIHEVSGGNPFYALELGRALPVDLDPTLPLPIPDNLEEVVGARLAELPEDTRRSLALAAALGTAPDASLEAAGVSWRALDPALAAQVIEHEGGVTRFTHPLLASVLYQGLSVEERRDVHRLLADVTDDQLERARHLALASDTANDEVAAALEDAAGRAHARGAAFGAADFAEHALRLTPADALEDRHRRTIAAARAQLEAGDPRRVRALALELLAWTTAGERAEALVLLSDVEGSAAHVERSLELRHEALEAAAGLPSLQAEIHLWLSAFTDGMEARRRHAVAALELAEVLDDDALRAGALGALAFVGFEAGDTGALQLVEQALELADATGDAPLRRVATSLAVWAAYLSHQLDRVRALVDGTDREWIDRDELAKARALGWLGMVELRCGRFPLAAQHAEQSRETLRQYADDGLEEPAGLWLLALIAAHRGELGRARALIESYLPRVEGEPMFHAWSVAVLGLAELWSGRPGAAEARFADADEELRGLGGKEPAMFWWRAEYAEALLGLGKLDEATALMDAWEAGAARLGRDAVLAHVTRCRGLVAAAGGTSRTRRLRSSARPSSTRPSATPSDARGRCLRSGSCGAGGGRSVLRRKRSRKLLPSSRSAVPGAGRDKHVASWDASADARGRRG